VEKTPFSFRTILFIAFCFFCAGDALGISAGQPARWWPVAAALLAAGGLARYQREPLLAVLFLCAGAGGFLLGTSDGPVRQAWHQRYGTELTLTGEWDPASLAVQGAGDGRNVCSAPSPAGQDTGVPARVAVGPAAAGYADDAADAASGRGAPQIFRANPGCYNSALAARVKRVYGRMSVSEGDWKVLPLKASLLHRWEGAVQLGKTQLLRRLRRSEGALLLGMVLGGYEGVREEDAEVLRQNGLAHLMAVSGTHVALLLAFAWLLLKRWESPWKTAFLLGLLAAYAVACSLRPAVLRAALMASALLWGRLRGRRTDPLRLLLLVAWILLLWQPLWLVDVGFQLSFVTVAGLSALLSPCAGMDARPVSGRCCGRCLP
jgi:competence protein ComEC